MNHNLETIFVILLISLGITHLNVERKRVLFKLMKFNDNFDADKANLKEFQEALKITENLEDKLFLKRSILLFKLKNVLYYICFIFFLLCVVLIVINTNEYSLVKVSESICYLLFLLFIVVNIIVWRNGALFRGMKYNDSRFGRRVDIKELQDALKIARDSEDELFLINSIRWYKLHTILLFTWLLSAILTLIISVNKLEF